MGYLTEHTWMTFTSQVSMEGLLQWFNIPYNETHYVNLNQLLLKEGHAEAKDYPNEFNPDVWQ